MLPRPLITQAEFDVAEDLLGTSGNGTDASGGHWWNECHNSEQCQVSPSVAPLFLLYFFHPQASR